ncbi:hypothetical protein F4821DRAFT_247846 [Hypoxylon rubiginosum]|uniref:Uncharacterized protein n=1 Tax=Hypoxylon rubiginosum TaxID=110542 RepID=A0ACC0CP40_9PEZI|nr:hypothetical protein F4821DRAFT_247846 [Hypoxylon rubiginosum]
MVHHGGPDFGLVVPMAGKPRMGTASFSRSTSFYPGIRPLSLLAATVFRECHRVVQLYNGIVPLFSGGVVGPGGRRVPTTIRVTRPQSIEPAKLIGISKRISGSSHHQPTSLPPIWANLHMQWPVIRPH